MSPALYGVIGNILPSFAKGDSLGICFFCPGYRNCDSSAKEVPGFWQTYFTLYSHLQAHYHLKDKRTKEQGMIPMNQTTSNCGFIGSFAGFCCFELLWGLFW